MWGALFSRATRPCYGQERAPLRYSEPSVSNACPLQSLLSPAFNNPPFHVNSHHIGSALFSSVLSQALNYGIMHPMWGALFSRATRPCYGQERAPLRYSEPSVSNACPLQSLLSPAFNNPPFHVNSHHIGSALFSSVLSQALNKWHHAPMCGALFSRATRPCYGQERAPLRYSEPSVSNACPLQSLLSPAFNKPPFHVNSHHMGSALFSSVLSQALNKWHHAPMCGALFSRATRPCYGQERAPLRYSEPSVSNACPLQSLLSPAFNKPPFHVNSHHMGSALFSSVLSQALNRWHHAPHVGRA